MRSIASSASRPATAGVAVPARRRRRTGGWNLAALEDQRARRRGGSRRGRSGRRRGGRAGERREPAGRDRRGGRPRGSGRRELAGRRREVGGDVRRDVDTAVVDVGGRRRRGSPGRRRTKARRPAAGARRPRQGHQSHESNGESRTHGRACYPSRPSADEARLEAHRRLMIAREMNPRSSFMAARATGRPRTERATEAARGVPRRRARRVSTILARGGSALDAVQWPPSSSWRTIRGSTPGPARRSPLTARSNATPR